MPTYFQRPENALKRANEFIDVGKKQRALDALYDVIKSKKHRTWQKIHEPIMEKYLELCVELRKSHIAKEGLYQYKNICQQVNIKSLEDVVRRYIKLAEQKTEAARAESHQVVLDVDDLDVPDTPESLLLKAVSGEDTQDRTDRAILTPWVKFLWESYRQCLDLLRNNSKVEKLYQDIAQQAFKFCFKYTRKTEFRKLCDNLRTHLGHVHKHQHQQTAINLNNPESQSMHLETRLVQLDSAISMELWQEAFKAVEDIHGLIGLAKKTPRPSLMANYYIKLGMVFWKSGNPLFHAATLHRLFLLYKDQRKNFSQEELQKMASRVLCSTLAVPIPPSRNAIDTLLEMGESVMEKQRRLASLLMLQTPPTRKSLIKDLVKYNVSQSVHPEVQTLFNALEVEFHPLQLYTKIQAPLEFIQGNDDLAQYVPRLEDIVVTRVLKQVSQVYQTIEFSRFAALVPFASNFRLERIIVEAARTLELQVRIAHKTNSLSFGMDLGVSQKEDVPEGPFIQKMPSEQVREQLTSMAVALQRAVNLLQPKDYKTQKEELKSQIINNYKLTAKKEHARILLRQRIIEDRKEQLEHLNDQREREEYEQQEEQRRRALEAEMARLDREARERERQRKLEETREIQKKHAMERIEQLKKSELGARVVQNIDEDDLAKMDVDDIMAKQVEHLEREKKELQERLRNQEKKIDHIARARRMKEVPLLAKAYEEESIRRRDFWEQQEQERIEKLKIERTKELEIRDRMIRMREDRDEFVNNLNDRRKKNYKEKVSDFNRKLTEERKRRMQERKEKRKSERRSKWLKEKEEAEQKARDEALLREREEKERLEKEKREQEEKEYHDKLARLEEQAARQKQRDKEIEEREAQRREEARKGGEAPTPSDAEKRPWRPASSEGGWRERERKRHDSWKKDPDAKSPDDDVPEDLHDGPPLRHDFGNDRDGPPPRDDRGPPPRDRFPARDERDRFPARDERDRFPARDERDRFPARDERYRDDRGPPVRDDRDRFPARDERSSWRDGGRDGGRGGDSWRDRKDDRPPARDDWRSGGPPRDDRRMDDRRDMDRRRDDRDRRDDRWGPPRDRDDRDRRDDRWGPPRDRDDRDRRDDRRDDRWGPPKDDRRDRDDRGPWRPRGEETGGDTWRRGTPSRGGDRDRDRGGFDRGGDRGGRGGDSWRDRVQDRDRDFRRDDRDRGPPPSRDRDDRRYDDRLDDRRGGGGPGERDSWRRGDSGGTPSKWQDKDKAAKEPKGGGGDDDGWTTVRY